ncbi:MAG: TetR/AcrR family transcriptional regulator [Acidimicrobiales bacterium]
MIAVRERNPQRSRERILAAALSEFAAKGFSGARVEAIARRSGLNKQLISHHFGGKLGLYRAVMSRRRNRGGGEISVAPAPMPDGLAAFHELANEDPEWVRVLLWETLERGQPGDAPPGERSPDLDDRVARYRDRVAWVAAEQAAGRLPDDLDPDLLLLSLMGAALYPVLLPNVADLVCGEDTRTADFAERFQDHLRRLAGHLAARPT